MQSTFSFQMLKSKLLLIWLRMERRIMLALVVIAGFLQQETYSQCIKTTAVIPPGDGFIQSPNYSDELGKAANCTWEFASDGQDYMLVLTVVHMRTYYVVERKKVCSGFNKVKWNQDEIDCTTYLSPTYGSEFCSFYYSSNKCETLNHTCKTAQLTSFPVIVTYESDGKVLQNHSGPVIGFKMEYSYVQCLPEQSPTAIISTNAEHQTTQPFTTFTKLQQSTSQERTNRYTEESTTAIHEQLPTASNQSVATTIEIVTLIKQSTTACIVMGILIAILLIAVTGVTVLLFRYRSKLSALSTVPPATINQHENPSVPDYVYDNEEIVDELNDTYVAMKSIVNQADENAYEIPLPMHQNRDMK